MCTASLRLRTLFLSFLIATSAAEEPTPLSLQQQIDALRSNQAQLEARLASQGAGPASVAPHLRLMDLSLAVLALGGTSSERDATIAELEGGGHDPKKRGFTLPNAELAIAGAVDPYFEARANIVTLINAKGKTEIELEEAFARTTALPYGLEVKAGQFFTEFGRFNETHPHAWTWIDQPIICTRILGGDGMRGQGVRLAVDLPLPWLADLLVTVQNATGETMASFIAGGPGTTIGGRAYPGLETDTRNLGDLVWSARWSNALDLSDDLTMRFGVSGATGPNAAGRDTRTIISGAHLALRWHPPGGERGWPFVMWETEVIDRSYEVDAWAAYSAERLKDRGFFTQLLVGFHPGWAAGLRYEQVSGAGESVGGRGADPLRDDRRRISPLLSWQPSEFSRLRVQYDYDDADHLAKKVHSVWFGLDILLGSHPPHVF